ncbi:hypothetical protein DVR12_27280, partial [Chitinophaga silvatica]
HFTPPAGGINSIQLNTYLHKEFYTTQKSATGYYLCIGFVILLLNYFPMKKRAFELLVVYLVYFVTLLLYIHLIHASVAIAITSLTIWMIPLIVVLPTQFIAFIITVGWPDNSQQIDDKIYRITQGSVYTIVVTMVGISLINSNQ